MQLKQLLTEIERKRRLMYEARGDARLRISQELDLLIVEYMRMVRG
jgi:IS4 transposase